MASFEERISSAVRSVSLALQEERLSVHGLDGTLGNWESTFTLAERLCNAAKAMIVDTLGIVVKGKDDVVALEFAGEERCTFFETTQRELVEWERGREDMHATLLVVSDKLVTTITEHWWKRSGEARVCSVGRGGARHVLHVVSWSETLAGTSEEASPVPTRSFETVSFPIGLIYTSAAFCIDRSRDSCRTPRRNDEVEECLAHLRRAREWCSVVQSQLPPPRSTLGTGVSFIPLVPLLDMTELKWESLRRFHQSALEEKILHVSKGVDQLHFRLKHVEEIVSLHASGVDFLERTLYQALTSVLGRELDSNDFVKFVKSYMASNLIDECVPRLFSYSLRRSGDFDPDALFEVERKDSDGLWETLCRSPTTGEGRKRIKFSLNASTVVRASAKTFIHGNLRHKFSSEPEPPQTLLVRARQFGSVIVMLGSMGQGNEFLPEHAIFLENGDSLEVPLTLEDIPTQQQFREATSSVSNQQKAFLDLYRSMQVSQTAWAMCFVHVKPLMERVLRLPNNALTKELALTRRIIELFTQYHIPRDLLAVPLALAPENGADLLGQVRHNVKEIEGVLTELCKIEVPHPVVGVVERRVHFDFPPYEVYLRRTVAEGLVAPAAAVSPPVSPGRGREKTKVKKHLFSRRSRSPSPTTKAIEEGLREDNRRRARTVQVAVFGIPGAGKTTLLKQLQILHLAGFSKEEKEEFTYIARANCNPPINEYFGKMAPRILADDYQITDQDVLMCRGTTLGVSVLEFSMENIPWEVIEVANMSERRKFISQFEGVTAIIFMADLSDAESLKESMLFWEEIANSPWLRSTSQLLFLNKIDLFRERLMDGRLELSSVFPEYNGSMGDVDAAASFVQAQFLKCLRQGYQTVYTHRTCSIDTNNINIVFRVTRETLVRQSLSCVGLDGGGGGGGSGAGRLVVVQPSSNREAPARPKNAAPSVVPVVGGRKSMVNNDNNRTQPKLTVNTNNSAESSISTNDFRVDYHHSEPHESLVDDLESMGTIATALNNALDIPGQCIHQTLVKLIDNWTLDSRGGSIIGPMKRQILSQEEKKRAKDLAFDLMDALSVSGDLLLEEAELHVCFVATQRWDMSVMDTLVRGNVDLLESVRSGVQAFAGAILGRNNVLKQ